MKRLIILLIVFFAVSIEYYAFGQSTASKQLSIGAFYPINLMYKNPSNTLLEQNSGIGSIGNELKIALPIKNENLSVYASSVFYKHKETETNYTYNSSVITLFGGLNTGLQATFKYNEFVGLQGNFGFGYYLSHREYQSDDPYSSITNLMYQDSSIGFEMGINLLAELEKIGFTIGYDFRIFGKDYMMATQSLKGAIILKF